MGRVKECKLFKQAASPWGPMGYPYGSSTMANSGCGPTACACVIASNSNFKNVTPSDTGKWLKDRGHAIAGQGTTWAGIPLVLRAYGFSVTTHGNNHSSMFKAMSTDGMCAIFLFSGGSQGGVRWTNGGHYLACSGMEIKGGKHYFYMLDPGGRNNDGWFCWEDTMSSLATQYWTCKISGDGSGDITVIQGMDGSEVSESEGEAVKIEVDHEELHPYMISVDRNTTTKVNYGKMIKSGVVGVMVEAGYLFDKNHNKVTFRNPKAYDQVKALREKHLDHGYYMIGRARTVEEAKKEMEEIYYLVAKYSPALGVWIRPQFDRSKTTNDKIVKRYYRDLVDMGLKDLVGFYCTRAELEKITWKDFQDDWYLHIIDHVKTLDDINRLLDPKDFDMDNESGPVIGKDVTYDGQLYYKGDTSLYSGTTSSRSTSSTTTTSNSKGTVASKYTPSQFRSMGVLNYGGWRWTYYSEKVLPGGGLKIPGRHADSNGYICDSNDYICLASGKLSKGSIVGTPLGKWGKVYDSGCAPNTLDVYVNW